MLPAGTIVENKFDLHDISDVVHMVQITCWNMEMLNYSFQKCTMQYANSIITLKPTPQEIL